MLHGRCVQEFLAETHPSVYKQCSYVSLEASPKLAELQREQLSEHQGFSAIVGDARDASSWGSIQSVRSLLQLENIGASKWMQRSMACVTMCAVDGPRRHVRYCWQPSAACRLHPRVRLVHAAYVSKPAVHAV